MYKGEILAWGLAALLIRDPVCLWTPFTGRLQTPGVKSGLDWSGGGRAEQPLGLIWGLCLMMARR